MTRFASYTLCGCLALGVLQCAPEASSTDGLEGATDTREDAIRLRTSSPEARAQYDANVRFALDYRARCTSTAGSTSRKPRVLVTGFGRFLSNGTNATGQMVSSLVPGMVYPRTERPATGTVDAPGPQTAVGSARVTLPGIGEVDLCAMVLPVYWDLAAILVLKEAQSFAPDFVLMNGIAGERQSLWMELGGVNRALSLTDGSNVLEPEPPAGQRFAPIVPSATAGELALGARLSWAAVQRAALDAQARAAGVTENGVRLDAVLQGALRAGFPRDSNTYLCNNTSYVVNYGMGHPGLTMTLMQASPALTGQINRVGVRVTRDLRNTPRVFVHWPSTLKGAHLSASADVMRAMIAAQLQALRDGGAALPTLGNNTDAEIMASGGWF
ncbi:MAG: hypothetical protein Q8Q09_19915 [Deltaproteobacteria bacterium]|nr:hypothetical protein [Deltaproteobacteria bacterium]